MENYIALQFSVISVLCITAMLYFLHSVNIYGEANTAGQYYQASLICVMICAVADIFYCLRTYRIVECHPVFDYISEILYSLGGTFCAFFWICYTELQQKSKLFKKKAAKITAAAILLSVCLITVTTPFHRLVFSLEGNVYHRGILNVPITVLLFLLILLSGIHSLIRSFDKRYYMKRELLRLLFLYTVFLSAGQLLQSWLGSVVPFRVLSATILCFIIHERNLKRSISVDCLSHINNRYALEQFLTRQFFSENRTLCFLMGDIDSFKAINDTYGHAEGDRAIAIAADVLKHAVPSDYFVARYGGDEFSVVGTAADSQSVEDVIAVIDKKLAERSAALPYRIELSFGYVLKSDGIDNIPDLKAKADEMLYQRKREKKARKAAMKA